MKCIKGFSYFRKESIKFVVAVGSSVRPQRITQLPQDGLTKEKVIWEILKTVKGKCCFSKSDKSNGLLYMKSKVHLWHLAEFLLKIYEKICTKSKSAFYIQ